MEIEISVVGDPGELEVQSLYGWLRRDADFRRDAEVRLGSGGRRGDMGALDVINVLVPDGISLANLALAYVAWRGSRSHDSQIKVVVNGATVTVGNESAEQVSRELDSLLYSARAAGRSDHAGSGDRCPGNEPGKRNQGDDPGAEER
jgi:hypothetical protein